MQLPGETANASRWIGIQRLAILEESQFFSRITNNTDEVLTASNNISLASTLSIENQDVRAPLLRKASMVVKPDHALLDAECPCPLCESTYGADSQPSCKELCRRNSTSSDPCVLCVGNPILCKNYNLVFGVSNDNNLLSPTKVGRRVALAFPPLHLESSAEAIFPSPRIPTQRKPQTRQLR